MLQPVTVVSSRSVKSEASSDDNEEIEISSDDDGAKSLTQSKSNSGQLDKLLNMDGNKINRFQNWGGYWVGRKYLQP